MSATKDYWVKWVPGDFLHGVSDLEANEGWVYVIVLNLIYDKQAPWPYDAKRLARRCHLRQKAVEEIVEGLIDLGKLQLIEGCLTNPKAEKVIGKRKDVSEKAAASAAARWQDENAKDKENKDRGDADALRTGCGSDAKLEARDQRQEKKKAPAKKPPPPADLDLEGGPDKSPARQAYDLYNQVAARVGGHQCTALTESRRKSLNARLNGRGLPIWQEAMERVERSRFLCGEAPVKRDERPFKLTLEMLLRPDNFQRLMEGFYGEDREPGERQDLGGAEPSAWSAARWARVMEIYRVSGSWPDDAGPEPGQPGCIAPQNGDDYVFQ